ncbi:MAG: hypothetical protein ACOCWG_05410, partial [bacterium]
PIGDRYSDKVHIFFFTPGTNEVELAEKGIVHIEKYDSINNYIKGKLNVSSQNCNINGYFESQICQ